jgi:hypothetical protein
MRCHQLEGMVLNLELELEIKLYWETTPAIKRKVGRLFVLCNDSRRLSTACLL